MKNQHILLPDSSKSKAGLEATLRGRRFLTCSLLLFVLTATWLWAPSASASDVRRFLLLVDYIGSDYAVAVQEGKVVVPEEYREMRAFSADALSLHASLPAPSRPQDLSTIQQGLQRLSQLIEDKADPAEVAAVSKQIKNLTVSAYAVTTFPLHTPSLERGKKLYRENCAACHGADGSADTSLARELKPPPSKFNDPSVMEGLSPFKAFNVLSFGIAGTSMASFDAFSEGDRWNLAFYIFSLRFTPAQIKAGGALWNPGMKQDVGGLRSLASRTDGELLQRLDQKRVGHGEERKALLAYLRTDYASHATFDPLPYALAQVQQGLTLVQEGKAKEAYDAVLEAYLEGFELLEPQLQAVRPDRIQDLEQLFLATRGALKAADPNQSATLLNQLRDELLQVQAELDEGPSSPYFAFINSMTIILREGVEAALIVAAILAFLRSSGQHGAAFYVHMGWLGAIAATLISWFVAEFLIAVSGSNRELIEGIASLLAAVVLFYVSYWLLAKLEARRWMDFIKTKVQTALSSGHVAALAGVSFLAVYREGLETVLFYQALLLQGGALPGNVLFGFLSGLAVLAAVILAIFKAGLKIPLRYFFGLTSGLLYILATIFAGEGIYRLQQVDLLSKTPLDVPAVPTLGIYPNAEGLLVQAGMLVLFLGSLLWFFVLAPKRSLSHDAT